MDQEIRKRRSRKRKPAKKKKYLLVVFIIVLLALLLQAGRYFLHTGGENGRTEAETRLETGASQEQEALPLTETGASEETAPELEILPEEESEMESNLQERLQVVDSYENLGIADVSGYLNIRNAADRNGEVIGMLLQNSACSILETDGEWYRIVSGEISGYVNSQYILTGEAARQRAMENVRPRAVVTAQNVNIRTEPVIDPVNIAGQAFQNERFEVISQTEGWIETEDGFLSADYAEVRMTLNEARELDLRTMVLNQYENLVISKVTNYLNVRSTPENAGNGNIIGQLPGRAAGEILETLDGWYRIRSGNITGYISSDPQYTAVGQEARNLALESAELMAVVNTERLNVRMEPSTESRIWTQISQEERYPVLEQMDGWVRIELDTTGENDESDGAYLSTRENNVEVRYALAEAIRFSPLEEGTSGGNGQNGSLPQGGSLGTRVANYALQFVGNPYVRGGTSLTNGADCSGFVQSVMRNFGVSLPRTSREQSRAGTGISSSQMQPGDLIFYANAGGTVNHVAMYIGNGQVVHASSRRTGIRISTWNYRTPAAIRRVL